MSALQKSVDLAAIGECLIDFTPAGQNELGMQLFSRNPGGAPANVLAMYAKLGGKTAFCGKVGTDAFGDFLLASLRKGGVGTSALVRDENVPTTLAFVQLDETGNRSFTFYRKPGADIMLRKEEVPSAFIYGCGVFHFGSVSLTDEPCRTATLYAASAARTAGAVVSYDPNYRPFLWPDIGRAKKELLEAAALADVVKVSEDELFLLTGENDLGNGCRALQQHGPVAVVVTLGPKGAYCSAPACEAFLPTYDVPVVDTTGAGDAFWGALLWKLHAEYGCAARKDIAALTQAQWRVAMKFANAAGSLTTTKKGAIPAMPSKEEIDSCVRQKSGTC